MNFAVTGRGTYKRCLRKSVLTDKNGRHLTPLFAPLSLSAGTIVHRAHRLWLQDQVDAETLREHTLTAGNEAIDGAIKRYQEKVGCLPDDEETAPTYAALDFCLSMADNYTTMYGGKKLPDEFEFISAEQKISVPVPGTEHPCEACGGSGWKARTEEGDVKCPECKGTRIALHHLQGRLDGLLRHRSTGQVGVLERKTYSNRPNIENLKRVDQFLGYNWLVTHLGLPENEGLSGTFVFYDGLWRRHKTPKGRAFEDLFARYTITHSKEAMLEFNRMLPLELNDMYHLFRDPESAYKHVPWMGCGDCGVSDLCDAMTNGFDNKGRSEEWLLKNKYTERSDDADDGEEVNDGG